MLYFADAFSDNYQLEVNMIETKKSGGEWINCV
jgi:hypothetical protein